MNRPRRAHLVHALRLLILALIVLLMRLQASQSSHVALDWELEDVRHVFPDAASFAAAGEELEVHDVRGDLLGYALQTSPYGDGVIGFSGPTNLVVGLAPTREIDRVAIVSSADTRDHVQQVKDRPEFLAALNGRLWDRGFSTRDVEAVAGATLTSLAILEALDRRQAQGVVGATVSRRFPDAPSVDGLHRYLPNAKRLQWDADQGVYWVLGEEEERLGRVLRAAPAADGIIGYQGPTDTLVLLDSQQQIQGLVVGPSFDNEPYVGYVREDTYFATLLAGKSLAELAESDVASVEGVSGATMTSQAVMEGVASAAKQWLARPRNTSAPRTRSGWTWHDWGAVAMVVIGSSLALSPGRGSPRVARAWKILLIGYLGLTLGCVLSQAMLVGWAQHGVPWRNAAGLVCLGVAAFSLPVLTRRNVYCSHLCPHGAVQQLVRPSARRRVRLGARWRALLAGIPAMLLFVSVWVGMGRGTLSLVDLEPFDAYVWRVAGWCSLGIAIVGVLASCFVPMAYCRFGCPTGMLLNHVRFTGRAGDWTRRDWVALTSLVVAFWLWWT